MIAKNRIDIKQGNKSRKKQYQNIISKDNNKNTFMYIRNNLILKF